MHLSGQDSVDRKAVRLQSDRRGQTTPEQQGGNEQDQEQEEQDLSHTGSGTGYTGEPKEGRYNCHYQEQKRPTQHDIRLLTHPCSILCIQYFSETKKILECCSTKPKHPSGDGSR
jgi:hypothetical protein